MRIKSYKLFESEELLGSLDDLNKSLKQLKSFVQYQNRKRLVNKDNLGDISEDFKIYFYELIDEGWEVFGDWDPKWTAHIQLKKAIKRDGIESEVNDVIDRMSEIEARLNDEGFNSKFIIKLNGKVQQVQNPDSYRYPIYKFTGIGDTVSLRHYKGGKYPDSEYVYGQIDYFLV